MRKELVVAGLAAVIAGRALAQDLVGQDYVGQDYVGPASVGAQEQLFPFDDQEPWKHGYRQVMPYYGGWHKFRPYNYHHVFGQTQTANAWGMPAPYSQQFWHRYQAVPGGIVTPVPQVYPYSQPYAAMPAYQPSWTPAPGGTYVPPPAMSYEPSYQPSMVEGYSIPATPSSLAAPGY